MKDSIRTKFTLIFVGAMAFVLLACWGVNSFYLERFYTYEKKNTLVKAYNTVYQKLTEDNEKWSELEEVLDQISETSNVAMLMLDSSGNAAFSSASDIKMLLERLQKYMLNIYTEPVTVLDSGENYTIQRAYNNRMKGEYMEIWGFLPGNVLFIMTTPLASIQESVNISNRFISYVGIAAILLGGIVVGLATDRMTRPINELAILSERMSNLDFDVRYMGGEKNEIGVLGNSMNALSIRLEKTISELKSANLKLQRDIEEKIQIDEMRKEFLSNVSHELKTPIALIQGYAEGLQEGMCEDEESRAFYCEVIVDEANKMNTMVKQLLTLNALEFGNDVIKLERFDLSTLIRGVVNSAGILIQQKEADVRLDIPPSAFVWADEFKIEEVVTNYLNNALNHLDGERRIVVRMEQRERLARVSVFNTGAPIPEESLDKVWIKFYKVDKARTRAYGGSGIGLSIVKAIMDSHHQQCGVVNHPDGVEFWFELELEDIREQEELLF